MPGEIEKIVTTERFEEHQDQVQKKVGGWFIFLLGCCAAGLGVFHVSLCDNGCDCYLSL